MTVQYNSYTIPLLITVLPVVILFILAWSGRTRLSVRWFIALVLSVAALLITYALELIAADAASILFWVKAEYLFSFLGIPISWLFFILTYTGREQLATRRYVGLASLVPLLHVALAWTNEWHRLNWSRTGAVNLDDVWYFSRSYGPVFWMGQVYLFVLLLIATVQMLRAMAQTPQLFRGQIVPLIAAAAFPWLANILNITGLSPFPQLDLVPFAFALSCFPLAWSLFRHRLLDVLPAAYEAVLTGMGDAVVILDNAGRVLGVNPAMERLRGQPARSLVGQHVDDLFPNARAIREQYGDLPQAYFEMKQGAAVYDVRLSQVRDRRGSVTGRVVVARDITALKQAEQTVRDYVEQLERRNEELDAFSYTVAHDLKAPLATILGYAEIIEETERDTLTEEARTRLHAIGASALVMRDLINDLLFLARLRETSFTVANVDMVEVTRTVLQRFRDQLEARGITLDVMVGLPPALGHRPWMEELLTNLLSNAIKYIGKDNRAPQISIRGAVQGDTVRYEVRDNGLGIAAENREKIFEMFARTHHAEAAGTGIGLAIVARVAEKLNGRVGVESEPGQGSTFWFELPRVKE